MHMILILKALDYSFVKNLCGLLLEMIDVIYLFSGLLFLTSSS